MQHCIGEGIDQRQDGRHPREDARESASAISRQNIIDMLMTASSIEQRAIMAKECGDACKGMVEAVEAMRDNMNKDKETVD